MKTLDTAPRAQRMAPILDIESRALGCLFGVAIGDALGATNEFKARGSFPPVMDLVGGGPFKVKLAPGEWTDDTSMTLCLAESLVASFGFNAADQMGRYLAWYRKGYWSSIPGVCFDIGIRTATELRRFESTGEPFTPDTQRSNAPNGSLMRLAAVPVFYRDNMQQAIHFAAESSRTTHGGALCLDACRYYAALIAGALRGMPKEQLLSSDFLDQEGCEALRHLEPEIRDIASGSYRSKPASAIFSTGYVVHSLEAALWCFARSQTFRHGALLACNLGDDSDTVAAIYGALAGAYYGVRNGATSSAVTDAPLAGGQLPTDYAAIETLLDQQASRDVAASASATAIPWDWIDRTAMRDSIWSLALSLTRDDRRSPTLLAQETAAEAAITPFLPSSTRTPSLCG